jgi:radical SAM superfamily enzyme YgiQ (UPF0313 family)
VDLFNTASEADKALWEGENSMRWNSESEQIIDRYSTFLVDYTADILNLGIDLYAISVTVHSLQIGLSIAKTIKENNPKAAIILGGPECFPGNHGIALLGSEYVDAICTGEGDLVWPRILDHFSRQGNLRIDIPGIAYKSNDEAIVDGGVPKLVEDLDKIPFADYGDIDFARYGNVYQIATMTSRGCINTCAFCADRPNFHKYRHRSAQNVLQEVVGHLEVIHSIEHKHIVPYIHFNDSLVNGSPRELERFCEMVIESGVVFDWGAGVLIRKEMTEELLKKIKKAGCSHLGWGLESGCQEVLNLMHKRFFTIDLAKQVIKRTHECGIEQSICLIAGFPGETEEMFQETLRFARDYQKYFCSVFIMPMLVVPNSLVYEDYQAFGLDLENARDYLRWQTSDGSNTYEIRVKRLEMLRSVLKEKGVAPDCELRPESHESTVIWDSVKKHWTTLRNALHNLKI